MILIELKQKVKLEIVDPFAHTTSNYVEDYFQIQSL